jgi:hypothetical protein
MAENTGLEASTLQESTLDPPEDGKKKSAEGASSCC